MFTYCIEILKFNFYHIFIIYYDHIIFCSCWCNIQSTHYITYKGNGGVNIFCFLLLFRLRFENDFGKKYEKRCFFVFVIVFLKKQKNTFKKTCFLGRERFFGEKIEPHPKGNVHCSPVFPITHQSSHIS